MSNPPPSELCFLSSLNSMPITTKVRFLGCVTTYTTSTAVLILAHDFPRGNQTRALVDVNLLLSLLRAELIQVGTWVNVIGYMTAVTPNSQDPTAASDVHVQALMLWSAGPLDIPEYEQRLGDLLRSSSENLA